MKSTASDLVALVTAEVKLARLELHASVRHATSRATWTLIATIPLLMAYSAGVGALAVWLSGLWGWAAGLAATAASQAILGAALIIAMPSPRPPAARHG